MDTQLTTSCSKAEVGLEETPHLFCRGSDVELTGRILSRSAVRLGMIACALLNPKTIGPPVLPFEMSTNPLIPCSPVAVDENGPMARGRSPGDWGCRVHSLQIGMTYGFAVLVVYLAGTR